ncbi:MAG: acetyl-CoA carboxylase [Oscillospiraceae bacterium]|nr:acetyl-CoA carboxylase [Oscillospiraceae bacterium]
MENNPGMASKRLAALFDADGFVETDALCAPEVATGYGLIGGSPAFAFAEGGAGMTKAAADKIKKLYKSAVKNGAPVIAVYDSKGGDIKEGRAVLAAYGEISVMCAELSGVVPQVSVVAGLCAGAAAVLCLMADFVITTEKAELFMTPPFLSKDSAAVSPSGAASVTEKDEAAALEKARSLIRALPPNNLELPGDGCFEENDAVVTGDLGGLPLARAIADKNSLIEIGEGFGSSVTAFGSISRRAVGFIAVSERISAADCAKIARFVSFCDAFSIPAVTLADSEGFELSSAADFVMGAAKLAQTYAAATIPKIAVVTGNAVGGAYIALSSASDFIMAYESAAVFPITPKAAAAFMGDGFDESATGALSAAKEGFIDKIVEPENVREAVLSALGALSGKRVSSPPRKHVV